MTLHKESFAKELRRKTHAALGSTPTDTLDSNTDALDNDVSQFVQLVNQAAEEGLWEIDLAFTNRTAPELNKLASEIKAILFDVFMVVNFAQKKIKASWHPSNEF